MGTATPIRLAIVEDDRRIRSGLEELFAAHPEIEVADVCGDVESALRRIPVLVPAPEVVLMDLGLPDGSGIDCLQGLVPRLPDTQFLVYTVHDADDRVFEALKAGANGYLLKSSSPDQVIKAIHQVQQGGAPMSTSVARRIVAHLRPLEQRQDGASEKLTPREHEVLRLLAEGLLYKEIGDRMGITINTVGQHVHRIYQKLHVQGRTEAVNKYFGR